MLWWEREGVPFEVWIVAVSPRHVHLWHPTSATSTSLLNPFLQSCKSRTAGTTNPLDFTSPHGAFDYRPVCTEHRKWVVYVMVTNAITKVHNKTGCPLSSPVRLCNACFSFKNLICKRPNETWYLECLT